MTSPLMSDRRPRLAKGLALVRIPGGLVIDGAPQRQVFSGSMARELLPELCALLDGRNDVQAVATATGTGQAEVRQVLRLLDGAGLIEWMTGGDCAGSLPEPTESYLSRTLALTRRHASVRSVVEAAAATEVVLIAGDDTASEIAQCLRDGVAAHVTRASQLTERFAHRQTLLVVEEGDVDSFAAVAERAWETGIPLLRFGGGDEALEIGPLFAPAWTTSCPDCFHRSRSAAGWAIGGVPAHAASFAAGMVAAEAMSLLTLLTQPHSVRTVVRTLYAQMREERFDMVPEPDCACCLQRQSPPVVADALGYESLQRWTPWTTPQGADSVPAGPTRMRGQLAHAPKTSVTASDLPEAVRRICGVLAPSKFFDTYLLKVPGLEYPAYLFDAESGELAPVRSDTRAEPWPEGVSRDADAVIVLVAAPGRNSGRFDSTSYRTAMIAVGDAVSRIEDAAREYRLEVVTGAARGLSELLELREEYEVPAAVIGVRGKDTDATRT